MSHGTYEVENTQGSSVIVRGVCAIEFGTSVSGVGHNNLVFLSEEPKVIAAFAAGTWAAMKRLTPEEVAERERSG